MARKYTKVEQLTEIVKERHDQGETYGEIATTLISTISSVFHLKTVSLRLKFEARPHNPMKFYDSPLFSCLLLGEQSRVRFAAAPLLFYTAIHPDGIIAFVI